MAGLGREIPLVTDRAWTRGLQGVVAYRNQIKPGPKQEVSELRDGENPMAIIGEEGFPTQCALVCSVTSGTGRIWLGYFGRR